MEKILVEIKSFDNWHLPKSKELIDPTNIWMEYDSFFEEWRLMYSDNKHEECILLYSPTYVAANEARIELIDACRKGKECVEL